MLFLPIAALLAAKSRLAAHPDPHYHGLARVMQDIPSCFALLCCACTVREPPLLWLESQISGRCCGAMPANHYVAINWQTHAKFGKRRGVLAAVCCRGRLGLVRQCCPFRRGAQQPTRRRLPGPCCGLYSATGAQNTRKNGRCRAPIMCFKLSKLKRCGAVSAATRPPRPPAQCNAAPPWPSTRCGTPACSTCAAATAARTTHPASRLPG